MKLNTALAAVIIAIVATGCASPAQQVTSKLEREVARNGPCVTEKTSRAHEPYVVNCPGLHATLVIDPASNKVERFEVVRTRDGAQATIDVKEISDVLEVMLN